MAHLPDVERPGAPAIAMLPSIKGERIRIDAYRDAARDLADRGYPVVRFDYPAYGSDPGPTVTREQAREVMGEVADWFRVQAGAEVLLLAGGCAGGLDTMQLAAANPRVRRVVVQGGRLRDVGRHVDPRLSVGLAAIDRLPDRLRLRDDQTQRPSPAEGWNEVLLSALEAALQHANVVFLHGTDSHEAEDFAELQASAVLASSALARSHSRQIGMGSLNTTRELQDVRALRDGLVSELSAPVTCGPELQGDQT